MFFLFVEISSRYVNFCDIAQEIRKSISPTKSSVDIVNLLLVNYYARVILPVISLFDHRP